MMRMTLLSMACVVGCTSESGELACTPMEQVGVVAADETSAEGVTPAEVVARVQQNVTGTLHFGAFEEDFGVVPVPADLQITFVQVGDAVDQVLPTDGQNACEWAWGPNLLLRGTVEATMTPIDGSTPITFEDHEAEVRAYGPGDAISILATQDIALPDWLAAIAAKEPDFSDPAEYTATAGMYPTDEKSAYFRDFQFSTCSVGVQSRGHGGMLVDFVSDSQTSTP